MRAFDLLNNPLKEILSKLLRIVPDAKEDL